MSSNGLLRAGAVLGLMVIIPWVVVSTGEQADRGSVWILCLGIAIYSGWRLSGLITAAVPRLYEFMFWLFCYIFMGLAPASQLRTDLMPGTTPFVLPSGDLKTGLIVVLGIIGFEFGALWERNRRATPDADPAIGPGIAQEIGPDIGPDIGPGIAQDTGIGPGVIAQDNNQDANQDAGPWPASASASVSERTPMLSRLVPMLLISAAASAYVVKAIGIGAYFASRDERDRLGAIAFADPTLAVIIGTLTWVPALVVIHRIINGSRRSDGTRSALSLGEKAAVAVASVIIIVVNNPLSTARYVFGAMALSLVVLFGGFRNRRRTRWTMVGLLLALFVGFPLANTFRREATQTVQLSLTNEYQGNGDYDSFAQIHNAIHIADTEGYTYLQQPLGIALFWVPRSVWPAKPIDTGIYIGEHRGYSFTNLSAPLWAELYLIGGAVPVLLGFLAVGKVLRRADTALVTRFEAQRPLTVVGSFVPFYLMILLRGSLLQAMALVAGFLAVVRFTKPRVIDHAEPALERTRSLAAFERPAR